MLFPAGGNLILTLMTLGNVPTFPALNSIVARTTYQIINLVIHEIMKKTEPCYKVLFP